MSRPDPTEISDGYHTMAELYEHRAAFNALLFLEWAKYPLFEVHKSWCHSDGKACYDGSWFIVMAKLPGQGWISNHYEAGWWDHFLIDERPAAAEFDGHDHHEALRRMCSYLEAATPHSATNNSPKP